MNIENFKKNMSQHERDSIQKHADFQHNRMVEFALKQMDDDSELDYQDAVNQFFILMWAEHSYHEHLSAINS